MLGSGTRQEPDFGDLRGAGATEGPDAGNIAPWATSLTERQFQAMLVEGLRQRGWTVWTVPNMRLTTAGLPDVLAIHPGWDLLLAWELKTESGRVTPAQRESLRILDRIPGIYARVVRPSQWPGLRDWIDSVEREPTR
jgi:hypothetical protein